MSHTQLVEQRPRRADLPDVGADLRLQPGMRPDFTRAFVLESERAIGVIERAEEFATRAKRWRFGSSSETFGWGGGG